MLSYAIPGLRIAMSSMNQIKKSNFFEATKLANKSLKKEEILIRVPRPPMRVT